MRSSMPRRLRARMNVRDTCFVRSSSSASPGGNIAGFTRFEIWAEALMGYDKMG
jgi:hypothetical protein